MSQILKAELHCHTLFSDGYSSVGQCIKAAIRKNIDVLAITDHDTASGGLEFWNYQPDNLVVIPGEEISTDKGHVIGLFIQETIKPGAFVYVVEQILEQNAFPILAHPFHIPIFNTIRKKNVQSWNEYDIENIKGFEIYNAHNRTQANEFAVRWAQNKPITFTSGSDAHFSFEIGNALTLIEAENKSIAAIRDALGNRQTKPLNPVRNNHFIYLIIGILNKLQKNKYQYKSNSDIST